MWRRLSDWLYRVTSGLVALAALVIFILFSTLVLPTQSSASDANQQSPDLSVYYTAGDLYAMADEYGETGRDEYVRARFTFDLVWPLVYTFTLTTGITWLAGRAFQDASTWRYLNLLPLIGMAFDYLENLSTSLVMIRYPQNTPPVAALAGVFTSLKWITLAASFVFLIASLVVLLVQNFRSKPG